MAIQSGTKKRKGPRKRLTVMMKEKGNGSDSYDLERLSCLANKEL